MYGVWKEIKYDATPASVTAVSRSLYAGHNLARVGLEGKGLTGRVDRGGVRGVGGQSPRPPQGGGGAQGTTRTHTIGRHSSIWRMYVG